MSAGEADRGPLERPLEEPLRVVFFGTPDFAVPTLEALASTPDLRPALVVSQPSRRAGRGRRTLDPEVVQAARRLGFDPETEIVQVASVRDRDFLARLDELAPDVAVVVAFGQIFRRRLLELPRLGCINLHASLLPRWRGAAPIQRAIAASDRSTGVATMRMDRGLDTGPTILVRETPIGLDETVEALWSRLSRLGAPLMVRTLRGLARGALEPTPQEGVAIEAGRLERADGEVDWTESSRGLYDLWRGLCAWPGLSASLGGRPLKLVRVSLPEDTPRDGWRLPEFAVPHEDAGTIVGAQDDALEVVCGDGRILRLDEVQRAGKRAVTGADLLRGERLEPPLRFDLPADDEDDDDGLPLLVEPERVEPERVEPDGSNGRGDAP